MDFTRILPVEISELIFGYLSFSELIETTLVSKTWNTFIGESSNLMKNIKINFNKKNSSSKFKKIFSKSPRMYQHLEISQVDSKFINELYEIFKLKNINVKTVEIHHLNFVKKIDVSNFLRLLNATIEEISLTTINWLPSNEIFDKDFSQLKVLKVTNCSYATECFSIFTNCKNLVEFRIKSIHTPSPKDEKSIIKILHQNVNLKIFEYSSDNFKEIFEDPEVTSKYQFKLHTFENNICINVNFQNFFASQIDSIEKLRISTVFHVENLETIFKMSKLKELDLGNLENLIFNKLDLEVNTSIEKLIYKNTSVETTTFRSLVSSAPNVKELKIYAFNQDSMELVSRQMTNLEVLKMRTIFARNLTNRNLFPKIKKCQIDIINGELEDHLNAIPVADRSNFVSLILASNSTVLY